MKKFELEDRLVEFSVCIINVSESLKDSYAAKHLARQIVRSGTSPALNYGEAQGGESKRDFCHKLKIALKELRETYVCLKIIRRTNLCKSNQLINVALQENNELIAIFVKSIKTAMGIK